MAFCAGDLREHITLQTKTVDKTAAAFARETWTPVCEVAAAVSSVSGKDFYAAYAANAQDVITFTVRWVEGVNTAWRAVWEGRPYSIIEVNYLGARRDYMQLKCRLARQ